MKFHKIVAASCLALLLAGISIPAQSAARYTVSWNPVTDPTVVEVRVFRSTDQSDYQYIGSTPVLNSEYIDSGLEEGVRYYYCLRAANAFGAESGFSSVVSGLTLTESSTQAELDQCRINEIVAVDETTCRIDWSSETASNGKVRYWLMGSAVIEEIQSTSTMSTDHSVTISGLDPYRIYMIQTVAHDGVGTLTRSCIEYHTTGGTGADVDFEVSTSSIDVPEGGTGQFGVRLSAMPTGTVEVLVAVTGGDSDIAIQSGAALTFTATDWDQYQFVTVSAAEDQDNEDGSAQIIVATAAGFFVPPTDISAVEDDNDPGGTENPPIVQGVQISIFPVPFLPAEGNLQFQNLPADGNLCIYDLKGRRVWETTWTGQTNLEWNGTNTNSVEAAAGRYFIVIRDPGGNVVEKRVILAVR